MQVHDVKQDDGQTKQYLLTKGDNNAVDDRGLYNDGQLWLSRDMIFGRVDYPQLKFVVLVLMCILAVFEEDE
ncbi:Signal peptidase complex catalytic subunit sec11 [Zancudomyces culisetae]|uniref:Signal peptidase complex catalytic subunit SEC11 n=1 Tax=Zancudomyces culisetae TaxID=1213189 RepID=A0A1R1PW37_ZANCU|nr:Signal peptidase complex catalytic subunit sec11 [Zancudomyces culisetae]|eukprot:OMH85168.1 Signal peptidase complex catalytic subunit sec11 [Zancudomyces culisetae]